MKKFLIILSFLILLTGCGKKTGDYDSVKIDDSLEGVKHEYNFNFTQEEFKRIDGDIIFNNLAERVINSMLDIDNGNEIIKLSNSNDAIERVKKGEKDLALVTEVSDEKLGTELEKVPFLFDGFVFFTDKGNKVDSLTEDQIKQIYSGGVVNWNAVGGDDIKLTALQKKDGTRAKNYLIKFMGGAPIMASAKQYYINASGQNVERPERLNLLKGDISFSFYYYTNQALVTDGMKILKLNGVEPNRDTIRSKKYPLRVEYYAVVRKSDEDDSLGKRFRALYLTESVQRLATSLGYVGVKK